MVTLPQPDIQPNSINFDHNYCVIVYKYSSYLAEYQAGVGVTEQRIS